jgi:hypothetical protein
MRSLSCTQYSYLSGLHISILILATPVFSEVELYLTSVYATLHSPRSTYEMDIESSCQAVLRSERVKFTFFNFQSPSELNVDILQHFLKSTARVRNFYLYVIVRLEMIGYQRHK